MSVRSLALGCFAMLVASHTVAVGPLELRLDTGASPATFTLGSTLHTVHGEMAIAGGRLRFDPDGGSASGEAVLDRRGAVTGNKKRDRKMHADVLKSTEFPQLVFHLERVEGALPSDGSTELRLIGSLDPLGVIHDVEIAATVSRNGETIEGHGAVSIPYVAWGLEDPSVFVMRANKEILVELDVRGVLGR